jgi:pyruvate/2-oxoglutarate dehydrogenase complex dihydrolipoamide dehydrogenase (E3) component
VSLYDQGSELGGQTLIAAKAPGRDGFLDLSRYYTYQMNLLGVSVHLNTEVTAEMVAKEAPDAVVVATGSIPLIPDIPGIDKAVEMRQVLRGEVEAGERVVILGIDDDIQGLSVADFLAELGKKVEILCPGYFCGAKVEPCTRQAIYQRLFQKSVILSPHTWIKEVSGSTIIAINSLTYEERRIEGVDTVVCSYGGKENNALYYALKDKGIEPHIIGDAYNIRRVRDATMDGAIVGRAI